MNANKEKKVPARSERPEIHATDSHVSGLRANNTIAREAYNFTFLSDFNKCKVIKKIRQVFKI
ncbi:MAG: hypothetical protein PF690_15505 [Deltaproteobacteria bacterium]|nr:hypothetical protein [Deltaproteobacteria bacterium]